MVQKSCQPVVYRIILRRVLYIPGDFTAGFLSHQQHQLNPMHYLNQAIIGKSFKITLHLLLKLDPPLSTGMISYDILWK